jgi:hypothetical protein
MERQRAVEMLQEIEKHEVEEMEIQQDGFRYLSV